MTTSRSPSPKRGRRQGRPDADQVVGRAALVEAAIEALRATTPEALTLVEVAARAQVDPGLVRYYFGSKDGLLKEVVRTLVEREHEVMRRTMDSDASLEKKLELRLRGMIELVQANPNFHRLALDKMYGDADNPLLGQAAANALKLTLGMLHDHSTTRALRAIDPRLLHVAMIGMTEFFVTARPLLLELFGEDADLEQLKTRYVEFLRDILVRGVTQPA